MLSLIWPNPSNTVCSRIRRSLLPGLLLSLLPAMAANSVAADFGYQGTHILTHGALTELARAFTRKYGVEMPVRGGGCSDGIAAVVNDRYDLGGACCPLSKETASDRGLLFHRVAVDIKAVIVNPVNPIRDLTLEQVAAMHQGRLRYWREAGVDFPGDDRPVAVVFRDHCLDMDEPVRRILGLNEAELGRVILVNTDQEIVDYVAQLPAAIGVVSKIFAETAPVKIIAVDGIQATPAEVERRRYPLRGDLFIVTPDPPSDLAARFLEFVAGEEGQAIVGRNFGRIR